MREEVRKAQTAVWFFQTAASKWRCARHGFPTGSRWCGAHLLVAQVANSKLVARASCSHPESIAMAIAEYYW